METLKFEELVTEIQDNWQIRLPSLVAKGLVCTAEFLEEERAIKALIHTMCCKYILRSASNPGIGEDDVNRLSVDVGLVLSNDHLTAKLTDIVPCHELEDMFTCEIPAIKAVIDLYFNLLNSDPVKIENMGYSGTTEGRLFTESIVDKFKLAPLKKEISDVLGKTKNNPLSLKVMNPTPFERVTTPNKANFLEYSPHESLVNKLIGQNSCFVRRVALNTEPVKLVGNTGGFTKEPILNFDVSDHLKRCYRDLSEYITIPEGWLGGGVNLLPELLAYKEEGLTKGDILTLPNLSDYIIVGEAVMVLEGVEVTSTNVLGFRLAHFDGMMVGKRRGVGANHLEIDYYHESLEEAKERLSTGYYCRLVELLRKRDFFR